MGTNSFLNIWLRQSVPARVVYPPFDAPHMLAWDGYTKHYTHGSCACVIGKVSLQEPSIVQEKTFSWPSVRISATMEFAMKGMLLSCPDASKARRTFMNPSDAASILRIGLLLVLCHPSPMKQAPISL